VWLKSKDSYHLMRLRQISNFYHHSVVLAKKACNTSLINVCKSQPRKLWQTINSLLHRRPSSVLPTTTANITLPDCFSSFFTDKISKLHSSLGLNANQHSYPHTDPPSIPPVLDRFTSVTQDEIIKMILESPDKQCDLDPMPTPLLKECVTMLAPVIDPGTFPSLFKPAVVTSFSEKAIFGKGIFFKLSSYFKPLFPI